MCTKNFLICSVQWHVSIAYFKTIIIIIIWLVKRQYVLKRLQWRWVWLTKSLKCTQCIKTEPDLNQNSPHSFLGPPFPIKKRIHKFANSKVAETTRNWRPEVGHPSAQSCWLWAMLRLSSSTLISAAAAAALCEDSILRTASTLHRSIPVVEYRYIALPGISLYCAFGANRRHLSSSRLCLEFV